MARKSNLPILHRGKTQTYYIRHKIHAVRAGGLRKRTLCGRVVVRYIDKIYQRDSVDACQKCEISIRVMERVVYDG